MSASLSGRCRFVAVFDPLLANGPHVAEVVQLGVDVAVQETGEEGLVAEDDGQEVFAAGVCKVGHLRSIPVLLDWG